MANESVEFSYSATELAVVADCGYGHARDRDYVHVHDRGYVHARDRRYGRGRDRDCDYGLQDRENVHGLLDAIQGP